MCDTRTQLCNVIYMRTEEKHLGEIYSVENFKYYTSYEHNKKEIIEHNFGRNTICIHEIALSVIKLHFLL